MCVALGGASAVEFPIYVGRQWAFLVTLGTDELRGAWLCSDEPPPWLFG